MGSNNEIPDLPRSWESLKKLVDILQTEDVNEIPEDPSISKENTGEIETMDKYESLKKDIESGLVKNYYINKEGDIIQKVTVHLPIDMVTRLKKEAIDQRTTLSELIRSRLK
jgi:hypothetical protein